MENKLQTIAVENIGDILLLRVLERRIFLKIADQFKEEITPYIEQGSKKIIIDLSAVNVMNSSGLGVLILARDKTLKNGGQLILCGLRPVMKEIFQRMQLEFFFTFADSVEDACRILNNKNPCMDTGL